MTTLVVTNDFPPRVGGIESFVADLCTMLQADLGQAVVVLTSHPRRTVSEVAAHDRGLPHTVVRRRTPVLLPTRAVTAHAARLVREHRADRVVFGAAAPLALMAPALRAAGARRILALTHGHERWWARLPGSRAALRRIGDGVDVLSTISDDVAAALSPALSPAARARLVRLPPAVDLDLFTPASDPSSLERARPPRCIAVGRMVARKGFAELLDAWALVLAGWPAGAPPELVLVGDGPAAARLRGRAAALSGPVRFAGTLPRAAVCRELQAADVFAFPVRDQLLGLDQEGLGLAAIEAAASGLPVLVGASGGASETVHDGVSGHVLRSRRRSAFVIELAGRLADLLQDRARAAELGAAGRRFVTQRYGAASVRQELARALQL